MDVSLPLLALQMVFSLLFVVGFIIVIARFVQRRSGGTVSAPYRAPVRVIGRATVAQRASVQVVEVAGRMLVVGVTEGQVQMLTELSEAEREVIVAEAEQRANATPARPAWTTTVLTALGTSSRAAGDDEGNTEHRAANSSLPTTEVQGSQQGVATGFSHVLHRARARSKNRSKA